MADSDGVGGTGEGRGVGSDAGPGADSSAGDSEGGGTHGGGPGADLGAEPGGGFQSVGGGYEGGTFGGGAGAGPADLAKAEETFGIPGPESQEVADAIHASQGFLAAAQQMGLFAATVSAIRSAVPDFMAQITATVTSRLGISIGIALGLTPAAAIALGLAIGYALGKNVKDMAEEAATGPVGSFGPEDLGKNMTEGDGEKLREFFSKSTPDDVRQLLDEAISEIDDPHLPLYRRRSNIIGTGLTGLTIE